jgi:hypothetical protein
MDPVQKIWMYENWVADQNDNIELVKNHAYLLASFDHPDAVKQILGDDGGTHKSTDEEFEQSSNMVKEINSKLSAPEQKVARRKRRHQLKE